MRIAALLAILTLAGCADRGKCLESHTQTVLVPVIVGKTTIVVPQTRKVCIQWQYPDARQP